MLGELSIGIHIWFVQYQVNQIEPVRQVYRTHTYMYIHENTCFSYLQFHVIFAKQKQNICIHTYIQTYTYTHAFILAPYTYYSHIYNTSINSTFILPSLAYTCIHTYIHTYIHSQPADLLSNVGGSLMFSMTLSRALYRDSTGFAEARMDVRAFRVAMMPAFVTLTWLIVQYELYVCMYVCMYLWIGYVSPIQYLVTNII